jgi:hypothetical protein
MKYRPRRYLTDVAVTVHSSRDTARAQIRDISPHGARLIGHLDTAPDGALEIKHLNVKYPAKLCWRRDNSYGVIFKSPLGPAKLNTLRSSNIARRTH